MLKLLVAFALFLLSAPFLCAQSIEVATFAGQRGPAAKVAASNPDQAFYTDQESKTYFIDFENLSVNLSDIVVKNAQGKVVFKDEVASLPVNTIYELDLSRMSSGEYEIELHSYTGVIRKRVTLP